MQNNKQIIIFLKYFNKFKQNAIYMFKNCISLITAPNLPATTLASNCYSNMLEGCTSLTTIPELPATSLANYCYREMFKDCTSLNSIKIAFTDWSNATTNWFKNASQSGTFTCPTDLDVTVSDVSHVPPGWSVNPI